MLKVILIFLGLISSLGMGQFPQAGSLPQGADPFVYHRQERNDYFLFTTNSGGRTVPAYVSKDLKNWTLVGDVFPRLGPWAKKGYTWAPEIMKIQGRFVLYYTARHRDLDLPCIGVALSDSITGPYKNGLAAPLLCQPEMGGSIDASPFQDEDGKRYLLWKSNGNRLKIKTRIWIGELSNDGLSIVGKPVSLIENDHPWEGIDVEAPTLVKKKGQYYLFYSGAMFNTPRYAVGYAVSKDVMGPYVKYQHNPILRTEGEMVAPGHQSIFRDDEQNDWIVFHAYPGRIEGQKRYTRIYKLEWINGVPKVEAAVVH